MGKMMRLGTKFTSCIFYLSFFVLNVLCIRLICRALQNLLKEWLRNNHLLSIFAPGNSPTCKKY